MCHRGRWRWLLVGRLIVCSLKWHSSSKLIPVGSNRCLCWEPKQHLPAPHSASACQRFSLTSLGLTSCRVGVRWCRVHYAILLSMTISNFAIHVSTKTRQFAYCPSSLLCMTWHGYKKAFVNVFIATIANETTQIWNKTLLLNQKFLFIWNIWLIHQLLGDFWSSWTPRRVNPSWMGRTYCQAASMSVRENWPYAMTIVLNYQIDSLPHCTQIRAHHTAHELNVA